ncbi:citrate lyase holo-[acyl-carrier protein] synthase [Cystobacter ferrugineus]|uniref:citrate lyase holo-[acyl-carrier protein] synthase n=1 Tax=Cystobacter ferrugineus TaxID=83449 RepID=A0A1L9AWL4_9BACT|nr:citrate lyase holo-[acyl-carrier protein] synthase [Cystobacter ferrugineus]OJH34411.1 hypothetical protein BON30_43590 [Cystobacter ferrugineus]
MAMTVTKQVEGREGQNRALEARERRNKARQAVARSMSGRSLVELTLDGARENALEDDRERRFLTALQHVEAELGVAPSEMVEDEAGFYGLFVTPMPALLARRRASRIEAKEEWDQRLSIECYGLAGSLVATGKVPREAVGSPTLH